MSCSATGEIADNGVPIIVCDDSDIIHEPVTTTTVATTAQAPGELPHTGVGIDFLLPSAMLVVGVTLARFGRKATS